MTKTNQSIIYLGFLVSTLSAAEEAKVDITSFYFAGSRTRAAELCGKVSGVTEFPVFVKVLVDEKSKTPSIYNAVVGVEANFCATVVTYNGTASVSLWGKSNHSSAQAQTREDVLKQ